MASTIVLWLFLTFLFGGTMMILFFGYRSIEEQRAKEEQEREAEQLRAAEAMAAMPRFFAKLGENDGRPAPVAFDEALLSDLESYVKAERAVVAKFVNEPSLESLYRQPKHPEVVN